MFGRVKKLEEKYERLERIVKYSKDEPTFRIVEDRIWPRDVYETHTIIVKNYLYMYIDKEEYVVELIEMNRGVILPKCCDFKVEDNLAYFTVVDYIGDIEDEFIIDFQSGAYVHRVKKIPDVIEAAKEVMKNLEKEETECTDC